MRPTGSCAPVPRSRKESAAIGDAQMRADGCCIQTTDRAFNEIGVTTDAPLRATDGMSDRRAR